MSDPAPDPYAVSPPHAVAAATVDPLARGVALVAIVVGAVGLLVLLWNWLQDPFLTSAYANEAVLLVPVSLVIAVTAYVLARVRRASTGAAITALLVAVSPVLFMLAFWSLTWGVWGVLALLLRE